MFRRTFFAATAAAALFGSSAYAQDMNIVDTAKEAGTFETLLASFQLESTALIRIGAIVRGSQSIMPTGDTIVRAGDFVIVFALAASLRQVEQMFRVSIDFF